MPIRNEELRIQSEELRVKSGVCAAEKEGGKRLYMIGGPMGVGKTAACRRLQQLLDRSVFLDGDWCWDAHPFQVTEETREMVLENIAFLLNSFLRCSAYDHVIFCWVLHRREIWADLLRRLTEPYALRAVSLVCGPEALRSRLEGDIRAGVRQPDAVDRSLAYLPLYDALDVRRLDVTDLTPQAAAERILAAAEKEREP